MRSAGGIHVLRKGRFRLDGGVLVITLISLHGKVVAVELSSAAATALARRSPPLIAEVHLIFSCMVAKRFWFSEKLRPNARPVTDGLSICFRGVRYDRACRIDGADAGALSSDYPWSQTRAASCRTLLLSISEPEGGLATSPTTQRPLARTSAFRGHLLPGGGLPDCRSTRGNQPYVADQAVSLS